MLVTEAGGVIFMEIALRTEVLVHIFHAAVFRYGGHRDLCTMCVDWIVAPWIPGKPSSYVCLHDRTSFVIGLFDPRDLDIAVIGFDLQDGACIVRQIQGQFDGVGKLPRCWERTLLGTVVDASRVCRLKAVEVVPSWQNPWSRDHTDASLKHQLSMRYDQTPQRVGFRCALPHSRGNHVLQL